MMEQSLCLVIVSRLGERNTYLKFVFKISFVFITIRVHLGSFLITLVMYSNWVKQSIIKGKKNHVSCRFSTIKSRGKKKTSKYKIWKSLFLVGGRIVMKLFLFFPGYIIKYLDKKELKFLNSRKVVDPAFLMISI